MFIGLAHGSVVPPGSRQRLELRSDLAFGATDSHGAVRAVQSQGIAVAIDGAIYNRSELGQTRSDAELVADLYRRHGFEAMLARLNGDFAIALYDPALDTL